MLELDADRCDEMLQSDDPMDVQAAKWAQDLMHLQAEGYLNIEKDSNGQYRIFPVSR